MNPNLDSVFKEMHRFFINNFHLPEIKHLVFFNSKVRVISSFMYSILDNKASRLCLIMPTGEWLTT